MPNIIDGDRTTLGINSNRRVVDMSDKIMLLEPDRTPLTVLLMRLRKMKTHNPKYEWLEDVLFPRFDRVDNSGGYTAGATAITVDNGDYFRSGDLVKVPRTGEVMRVGSVSTNVLTISDRGWGTSTAAALVDNDELLNLSNAMEEGSNAPTAKTTQVANLFNYSEIIRTPFSASRTNDQSDLYGGSDRAYLRKKAGIEHMVDIERRFWFGARNEDTTNIRRSTGGVLDATLGITTNVTNLDSSGLTEATWEDWLRDLFRYGNKTKFVFASPLTISKINGFGYTNRQIIPTDQTFGLSITKYLSGHGTVNLVRTIAFEGDTYDEYAIGLDLENVSMRVMQDVVLKTNIHDNDFDGWKDEYLSEVGFQLTQEKTHGYLTNVGGAAVT